MIKERFNALLAKIISLKVLIGIPILLGVLFLGKIDGVTFVIGLMSILGIRAVEKIAQARLESKK
jgi:hypothetical protein